MNEKSTVRGRPFAWLGLGLFVSLGLVAAACWLLTAWWAAPPSVLEKVAAPQKDARWNDRAPQLRIDEAADLRRLRGEQDRALHQAGWIDSSRLFARIPIEDAMRLIATGREFFPATPLSPEAMRQSRAAEIPPTP